LLSNPAVSGNIARQIVVAALPLARHLMPEEGADSDEENDANKERRGQYAQVLQSRFTPSVLSGQPT
jgi:hypothetical protein